MGIQLGEFGHGSFMGRCKNTMVTFEMIFDKILTEVSGVLEWPVFFHLWEKVMVM